jgi:tetratricopeptide (TPR) repeat protein/V8-like Glu-specific endopeptidase
MYANRTFESIKSDLDRSVVRIQSGNNYGTAFLVDVKDRLFLTASHVLKESVKGYSNHTSAECGQKSSGEPMPQIVGSDRDGHRFNMCIKAEDKALDAALLYVDDTTVFKDVWDFELYFENIGEGSQVTYMGFPNQDTAANNAYPMMPKEVSFSYSHNENDGDVTMAIPLNIEDVASGAPVFTSQGVVVGMVTNRRGVNEAVAIPMKRLEVFLTRQGVSDDSLEFRKFFLAARDRVPLERRLRPSHLPESISNLHLLGAINLMLDKHDINRTNWALFDCPLAQAAHDRGLYDAAARLYAEESSYRAGSNRSPSKRAEAVARTLLAEADVYRRRGDENFARRLSQSAVPAAQRAVAEAVKADKELLLAFKDPGESKQEFASKSKTVLARLGVLDEVLGGDDSLLESYNTNLAFEPQGDRFARLLQESVRAAASAAGVKLGAIGPYNGIIDLATSTLMATAASWAALTARSPEQKASAYWTLGDVLLKLGQREQATKYYSEARQISEAKEEVGKPTRLTRDLVSLAAQ